jgi:hypothetical protein
LGGSHNKREGREGERMPIDSDRKRECGERGGERETGEIGEDTKTLL